MSVVTSSYLLPLQQWKKTFDFEVMTSDLGVTKKKRKSEKKTDEVKEWQMKKQMSEGIELECKGFILHIAKSQCN